MIFDKKKIKQNVESSEKHAIQKAKRNKVRWIRKDFIYSVRWQHYIYSKVLKLNFN